MNAARYFTLKYAEAYAISAKLAACDSGNPYSANELMFCTMVSCVLYVDAVGRHARAQLAFKILHALPGAAHAHGAAQLLGLRAGKVGDGHGHAQQLLLKERHAQRALQHRLQRWDADR